MAIKLIPSELQFSFIRSRGPGGQNVNKVATAVLLRFNLLNSQAISDTVRARLMTKLSAKLTASGEILIKANRYRTQESNKRDARLRLLALLTQYAYPPKMRKATKPTKASKERRIESKKLNSKRKSLRKMVAVPR